MDDVETLREVGSEPTVTFGVTRATDGEVVGPLRPISVQYGQWSWNFHGLFPMVVLNFNKYHAHLPPWDQVIEMYLASEEGDAMAAVASHLGTMISGRLKTVSLGAHGVSSGKRDGGIISPSDVLRTESDASKSTSDYRIDEVLE